MLQKISRLIPKVGQTVRPVFLSTYVPSQCGLATFTRDLATAVDLQNTAGIGEVVAITQNGEEPRYPHTVTQVIRRNIREDYRKAAQYINDTSLDVVSLQHEYGIFGGEAGLYVLDFLKVLKKPVVTTLHTVLSDPSPEVRRVTAAILKRSAGITVMLPHAKREVVRLYEVEPAQVSMIHHGVTILPRSAAGSRSALGWSGKQVLLGSGLIHRNKGFEHAIKAMPKILEQVPNAHLVILGQTHPIVLKQEGERYRQSLEELARRLGVAENVTFINRYLERDDLLRYFAACDIYLTPHLDPLQITSGTLAYALGMGRVCISTPYLYAQDMLSRGRGVLVDFANSDQLAEEAIKVLTDAEYRTRIERNARQLGELMSWDRVARSYLRLFRRVTNQSAAVKVVHPVNVQQSAARQSI